MRLYTPVYITTAVVATELQTISFSDVDFVSSLVPFNIVFVFSAGKATHVRLISKTSEEVCFDCRFFFLNNYRADDLSGFGTADVAACRYYLEVNATRVIVLCALVISMGNIKQN